MTATRPAPTATATETATPDPFAFVSTATPLSAQRVYAELPAISSDQIDSSPSLNISTPSFNKEASTATAISVAPLPTATDTPAPSALLPSNTDTVSATPIMSAPEAPPPSGVIPTHLSIPSLALEVPVDPAGMIPSSVAPGVFEWDVPAYRAAGWLNTSAALGQPGNTVLDGHHNIYGEIFKDISKLQPGDEITLSGESQSRRYTVSEVLILPERDQPLEIRLQNAHYIQPTTDERLTLISCWPYNDNSHRVVGVALRSRWQVGG